MGTARARLNRAYRQVVKASDGSKVIVFDGESRRKLQAGINKVADAVSVTLGPRGEWTGWTSC